MKKYAVIVDEEKCWGCMACPVACKQEFDTPDGVSYISVSEEGPRTRDGKLEFMYRVNLCRHCDHPPCAEACPVEALEKREDGIVVMDYDLCTGCRSCLDACPYGVISFDEEKGIAQKCNLCYHRVDRGLIPACADNVCLAHCIHFKASEE